MSSIKNFFYIAADIEICYTFSKINVIVQHMVDSPGFLFLSIWKNMETIKCHG